MSEPQTPTMLRVPVAALLAWFVPGLGHIYLGHRARGIICLVAIIVTFWSGVAIGGVQGTVAPHARKLWFVAQLGTVGNTLAAYGLHVRIDPESARSETIALVAPWSASEIGVHYTGVAGLLNLLVIFDAVSRAENPIHPRRRRGGARSPTPQGAS